MAAKAGDVGPQCGEPQIDAPLELRQVGLGDPEPLGQGGLCNACGPPQTAEFEAPPARPLGSGPAPIEKGSP